MKNTTILAASIAILGSALHANAQSNLSYTADDLILGFRAPSAATDYLVDIGPVYNYINASGSFVVSGLGNTQQDLINVFGSGWATETDLYWSISGVSSNTGALGNGDAKSTVYASAAETSVTLDGSPHSTDWTVGNSSSKSTYAGKMTSLEQQYVRSSGGTLQVSTTNSTVGMTQPSTNNTTYPNNYASFMPGGGNSDASDSFKYFNPTVEANSATGITSTALDLWRLDGSASTGTPGTYVGTFSLNNSGALTFTKTPEPATVGMLLLGFGALAARRRRTAKA